jgi:poly [ADP-ribose] polymerase 2/3/4
MEALRNRYDMCNILLDMYGTSETIRNLAATQEPVATTQVPAPVDLHYQSLKADLTLLSKTTDEFATIQTYFEMTKGTVGHRGPGHPKLLNVWSVDREGEDQRFAKFDQLDNRQLLWHGTNIAVVVPILTNGLRIMPHSGGRVGAGIYLACMQENSAQYTSGYGAKFA